MFKRFFYVLLLCLCVLLIYGACAGAPASQGTSSPARQPDWIRDPYSKYDRNLYVAARGSGNNPQVAESTALGNLVGTFDRSIQIDEKISTSFQQAVKSGVTANWSENTAIDTTIASSAGMDTLLGAEIGETWNDGKNEYWAVAILDKQKAILAYSDMVKSNQAMIRKLIDMPASEKGSLEGYARYSLAAVVADINVSYGNLLTFIGMPVQGLQRGDDFRLEASSITKTIPVGITVRNDKSGRIQGAFAKALSDLGFQSGGANSRYVLDVDIATSPVELANNANKFSRIEVTGNLKDTMSGTVLVPYNFNFREGHTTQAEAENRAYATAERKINEEYKSRLDEYLSMLLPKR